MRSWLIFVPAVWCWSRAKKSLENHLNGGRDVLSSMATKAATDSSLLLKRQVRLTQCGCEAAHVCQSCVLCVCCAVRCVLCVVCCVLCAVYGVYGVSCVVCCAMCVVGFVLCVYVCAMDAAAGPRV